MKQSIAYTQTLNIMIVFIVIIFTFLISALNYYKAYKVTNAVAADIEKYEGYNLYSESKIIQDMKTLGYSAGKIRCSNELDDKKGSGKSKCSLITDSKYKYAQGSNGYCAYRCKDSNNPNYYYYKVTTGLFVSIPIINDVVTVRVSSVTDNIYDFECAFDGRQCSKN